jgi:YbbR domain-containing protein
MKDGMLARLFRRLFVHNLYLKAIAAILTLALYIWVSEDRETVLADTAPVRIVVPDDMVLVSDPPDRVRVTIRGRWSEVQRFDITQLEPIRIDLSRTDRDRMVHLSPNMVRVPPGLRVTHIDPPALHVVLEPESERTVPIRATVTGEPNPSFVVTSVETIPDTALIRGPESRLEEIHSVSTDPVDVSGRTRSLRRTARLQTGDGLVTAHTDQPVTVIVEIETQVVTETFTEIPVTTVNTAHISEIEPLTTDVTLRGPKPLLDSLDPSVLRAEIDLGDLDEPAHGTYSRDVEIFNVPPEVEVTRVFPLRFRVTVSEP